MPYKGKRKYYRDAKYQHDVPPLKPIGILKAPTLRSIMARLCEEAGIVVRRGRFNRQIIHLVDVLPLLQYLGRQYRPARTLGFDRASLVTWLSGLEGELEMYEGKRRPQGKAGYARRVELEIHRIGKLDEPARTIAAVEFMGRIRDAGSVVKAAKGYLKDNYGDLSETRYAGGTEWWRELESLAGLVRPVRPGNQLALSSDSSSTSSSSS
jgi:hypothetical protein